MRIAIIGPKGSGKSELYRALLGKGSQIQKKAIVKVKDNRLNIIKEVFNSKKITYPEIEYLDVPGGGEDGLGKKMLNHIRPYECLLTILNCFSNPDPYKQWKNIESDLMLSDLGVIEKRLEKIALDKKKSKNLVDEKEESLLIQAKELLGQQIPLRERYGLFSHPKIKGFEFLSLKPILFVWNVSEQGIKDLKTPQSKPKEAHVTACIKLERELLEIEDENLKKEFMNEFGIKESVLDTIISTSYKIMDLITFFTADTKEAKGWTVKKGTSALKAAGCVHSDMERGFIRAEVISWKDFRTLKDLKKAKEKGLLRLEGKDYVVKDGDLIRFRFKV